MAVTVDPRLMKEIKRYGAFDISACFNCGNCTAVCSLSEEQGSFPRKLIRLGQLGDRERLIESPEPWLCYYCGECSDTCPRQAEPGEYMAALRRYAIAAYEPTGVAGWMYKSAGVGLTVLLLLAVVLGAFLVGMKPGSETAAYAQEWLFKGVVAYSVIHNVGIGIFVLAALITLVGCTHFTRRIARGVGKRSLREIRKAVQKTLTEIATMQRHSEEDGTGVPQLLRASFVHKAIMYGFGGLLLATILDFAFIVLLPLGTTFWPARVLGVVSGIAMMYGVCAAMWRRVKHMDKSVEHSAFADWWLNLCLLVVAATGFWLLGVVSFRAAGAVNDAVLLVHAALAMELVLLTAFTKLAHVLYRPMALFAHYLRTGDAGSSEVER